MKRLRASCLALLLSAALWGQDKPIVEYKIQGKELICTIDTRLSQESLDSLLGTFGLSQDKLAIMLNSGSANDQLWKVADLRNDKIILHKSLRKLVGKTANQKEMLSLFEEEDNVSRPSYYTFGVNQFKKPAIIKLDNGLTRFYLKVEGLEPESVFLSGSFNECSTSGTALSRCDSGYYVDVKLDFGPHLYKYIVDGYWLADPRNLLSEIDFMGNENSLYFNYNYRFFLPGQAKADEVFWASSVNDWDAKANPMELCSAGWELNLYLEQGTYAYKYVVDGTWILDSTNALRREDDQGNVNSYVSIGDTFYFYYPFNLDANTVHVTGDFNLWSRTELPMEKSDTGWVLPYVLAAGNYEYKFIVDQGEDFKIDPLNPLHIGGGDYQNSVLSIQPNTEFFFPLISGVEEVILTGSFMAWRNDGFLLTKEIDGWHGKIHLPKGKNTYRFIINGQWAQDPNNPLYEPNEFGEFNSIIWSK
jgi:hypothetical protein